MNQKAEFKRVNFFKGLFTTAEDWRAEQSYHIEKRQLHNRCFHTPGVVIDNHDLQESLKVIATEHGQVKVLPGYAVDGNGRDLYLPATCDLDPPPETEETNKGAVLYIYIAFGQKHVEKRDNLTNPNYSGEAFVVERPTVGWTDQPPDNSERIELARVHVKTGRGITQEHIDSKHVVYAGTRTTGSIAKRVQSGTAQLNPAASPQYSADRDSVLIATFANEAEASAAAFVANAFPIKVSGPNDSRIQWWIESSVSDNKEIQYYLFLKNLGTKKVEVRYDVYRLNLGNEN
jgi:hypothetical protein